MLSQVLALAVLVLAQDGAPAAPAPAAPAPAAPAPTEAPAVAPAPVATITLASVVANPPADATAQAALDASFRAAIPTLDGCYAAQRERAPESVGDLLAQVSYGKKGEFLTLSVLSAGVLDDDLRVCARDAIRAAMGPTPTGPKKAQLAVSYELRQTRP